MGILSSIGGGIMGGATVSILINAVDNASAIFAKVNKGMLILGGAITAIGIAGAGAVGGLLKMAGQFEQTEIAFTTMLGSAEKADKLLKELADFAAKTPFTIPGIEQNAKMLLAMSIPLEDLLPTLKSLGDIASGLNVPMERLALNFGQVRVQGKLTGRELRDFSVAGVPLIAELAKNLNIAETEVKEMVSAGKIGFAEVEEAFKTMTGEGGKFFDLMDAQSKTFLGVMSNIQDSFIKLGRVMGKMFLPIAKFAAGALEKIVGWMEQHPIIAKFAAVVLGLITVLALLIGPLIILGAILPALATGWAFITTGTIAGGVAMTGAVAPTVGLTGAMTGLAASLTAVSIAGAPLWLVIVAIIAIIAGLIFIGYLLIKNWDAIKAAVQKFGISVANAFIKMRNTVVKVWNSIVTHIENSLNAVIGLINKLIGSINLIPGIEIPLIPIVDLRFLKGRMMALKKYIAPVVEATKFEGGLSPEEQIAKTQEVVAAYRASFKDIDIMTLPPEIRPYTGGAGTVNNFNIENINGMTGKDVADSLQEELNKKITAG